MANRKDSLTGSEQTDEHQPDQGPDSNLWARTRDQAGYGASGSEKRTGPKANRFQRINRLEGSLLFPTFV